MKYNLGTTLDQEGHRFEGSSNENGATETTLRSRPDLDNAWMDSVRPFVMRRL
jgi:hypothetical protein